MHSTWFVLFPGGSDGKEFVCNKGDPSLILGSGRSPGEGNGCSLQYPCLENLMDRGAWQATVRGVTKSGTRLKPLRTRACKQRTSVSGTPLLR